MFNIRFSSRVSPAVLLIMVLLLVVSNAEFSGSTYEICMEAWTTQSLKKFNDYCNSCTHHRYNHEPTIFLETLDSKTEKEYKDILEQAARERAERRLDTSRYGSEKRGKVFIRTPENSASDSQEWYHCVLKANMLFLFKQPTDTSAVGVICFDGCSLSIIRNKTSKFHKKNGITVLHAERELLFHSKILNFYFENGKELETWYWFLKEAAALTLKKTPEEELETKVSKQFFADLPVRACVPLAHQAPIGNMNGTNNSIGNGSTLNSINGGGHKRSSSNSSTSSTSTLTTPSVIISPNGSITNQLEESVLRERKSASSYIPSSSSSSSNTPASSTNSSPPFTSTSNNNTTNNSSSPNINITGVNIDPNKSKVVQYDWLNVLLGRVFFNLYNSEELLAFASSKITKKLNKLKKPSILKSITLQNLDFGPNLPILQDAQLLFLTPQGELSVDLVVKYQGGFTLTIRIEVSFSIRGRTMTIPLVISVLVKSLSGRLNLQCLPPPTKRLWVGFYEEPQCEIEIDTSIGESKSSYFNMPKIAKVIVNKLKAELFEMMVLPNTDDWPLPSGHRRKKAKNEIPPAQINPTNIPSTLDAPPESMLNY
ncbi:PH domain-containing protein [Heterostelium album PN500]|uniref:PH domain-containing protein n=1 Tax=Heterostelium pallidum (strain ATCC 26659 / Pp 5 / PN500) TaxID=670386 RepID=D3B355_HETP5|nr:PH domain-containing protein [Heterostelium album PN500]EFA83753.1 PH domain-containing protein [Heterostelium album PN500]|eukprot:XP_020435870.1 PH domain-containing protein [Heterostelium album PN500]